MTAILVPFALYDPSVTGAGSVPPWKLDGLKDLSEGGICETGYGQQNKTRQTLQYLSTIKHREKYTSYLRWGTAVIPALLDVIPAILTKDDGRTPLKEIPGRAYAVVSEKLGRVSAEQLGFLLSIIPLYHGARAMKNSAWPGTGIDPSGHIMFKMAQYGMMLSITTEHGTKSSLSMPITYYIAFTVIADALMLANTVTNCHTLVEVFIGGGIGAAILSIAYLISQYTPFGRWAQWAAGFVRGMIGGTGNQQTQLSSQMVA